MSVQCGTPSSGWQLQISTKIRTRVHCGVFYQKWCNPLPLSPPSSLLRKVSCAHRAHDTLRSRHCGVRIFLCLRSVAALVRLQRLSRPVRDRGAFLASGREDRAFRLRGQNETLITVGHFTSDGRFEKIAVIPPLVVPLLTLVVLLVLVLVLLVFMMAVSIAVMRYTMTRSRWIRIRTYTA